LERLNYFNQYNSKESHHEDVLTRAYLILLKHSFHVLALFIDYCKTKHHPDVAKSEETLALAKLIENGWGVQTQKGNPAIESDWLLSILITDINIASSVKEVQAADRRAVYDGMINFGNRMTFIIENKPRSQNVWFGQLSPSLENLSVETKIYSRPVILEWKEIIKHLNLLLSTPTLTGSEKMLVEDFLEFIDVNFSFLNPFDNLSLCKGNYELIQRRILNLLKLIVKDENMVQKHRGWGYYIQTPYAQIREIGLILNTNEPWQLELSLYFGATQTQARTLYTQDIQLEKIDSEEWNVRSNFHVAYQSSNLVWFEGCKPERFIEFWREHVSEIYQNKKADVRSYIDWLYKEGILIKNQKTEEQLQSKFFNTAMPNLNICPELEFIYDIKGSKAEVLDKDGKMEELLTHKIIDCLKVMNLDPTEILK
jgi:hypothetical protein